MALRKDDSRTEVARCLAKELGTQSRSVEWIIENGLCVENLLPGPSRLPHAGQGAIAQFPLTKGETIVPAPLLQIIDRDVLATYDHRGEKVGTQLLMNYCFGHRDSSILLCPDTNAILINHCSTRQKECEPRGPNAKVQWASWEKDNDRWLQMPLQELGTQRGRGLAINIVATRDIYPGEEVRNPAFDDAFQGAYGTIHTLLFCFRFSLTTAKTGRTLGLPIKRTGMLGNRTW